MADDLESRISRIESKLVVMLEKYRRLEAEKEEYQRKTTELAGDVDKLTKQIEQLKLDNDPTAHAEVNAIRKACAQTGNFKLDGCVVYSSCEPCPMCLSALYWAGVKKIYYGNTKTDARDINFDDKFIYDELEIEPEERHIPSVRINLPEAILAFKKWADKTDKIEY